MARRGSIPCLLPATLPVIALGGLLSAPVPPALAQVAAPPQSTTPRASALLSRLFEALKQAGDETEARQVENEIWHFLLDEAPDRATRKLVDEAMEKRGVYDFAGARALLDRAIERAPQYAEAYNQRGFVRFLQEDYDGALEDVGRAIALEPKHFAAMSGRALILMRQGRFRLAQTQLREAVAIHPFLKERSMIVPEPGEAPAPAPPDETGVDL